MNLRFFLGTLSSVVLLASCSKQEPTPPTTQSLQPPENQQQQAQPPAPSSRSANVRYALFLNRMRSTDPEHKTMEKAMINDQNEIGVILDKSVETDKVPDVMKTLVGKMATEFPDENLTLHAYTPGKPPQHVGVAKLDAKSKDVTYTPGAN